MIIDEFVKGDRKAFSQIFDKYYAHLCYFANRLTGNEHDAEDIVIKVLNKLMCKHKDFKTVDNIKAFLYVSVRNESFNYIERKKKVRYGEPPETGELNNLMEIEMINAKLLELIYESSLSLSALQKSIFDMSYRKGMSVPEIASELGVSTDTVSRNKYKATSKLKCIILNQLK